MKRVIIASFIVLAFIGLFLNTGIAKASKYYSTSHHYSFDLPDNWIEIPYDKVIEAQRIIVDQSENQDKLSEIIFDAGFQKYQESEYYFTYPYLLTRTMKGSQPSEKELREFIGATGGYQEITEKYFPNIEVIADSNLNHSFYSVEENRGYSTVVTNYPGIGEVVLLMVIIPGHEGIVLLQFYCLKDDYENAMPSFEYIANSFIFDKGYKYKEGVTADKTGEIAASVMSWVIILLVIWGIQGIYKIYFKKKSGTKDLDS